VVFTLDFTFVVPFFEFIP